MSRPIPAIETGTTINNLNTISRAWYSYRTRPYTSVVFQFSSVGASWPAGVTVDIEMSQDGIIWSAFSTAQQYTANGISSKLDIQNIGQVRARVAKSATDGTIRVIVFGDTNA
jgi:hypothetical protein